MTSHYSLHCPDIKSKGHKIVQLELPSQWKQWRLEDNFVALDQAIGQELAPDGLLFTQLAAVGTFENIEHILALRTAPEDEEGIWHDDGSRNFAFSLGLNLEPEQIRGGMLNFRRKGQDHGHQFSPLRWGEMVIFLTGVWGYEHQVSQVTLGQRLVAAGWCS